MKKINRKILIATLAGTVVLFCYTIFLIPSAFRARRNMQNIKGVNVGMLKSDVLNLMGAPDEKRISFLNGTDSMFYYIPPFGASHATT